MYCELNPRSVSQPDWEDNQEDWEERNQDVEDEDRGEYPGERLRPQAGQDVGELRPDLEEGVRALVQLTDKRYNQEGCLVTS